MFTEDGEIEHPMPAVVDETEHVSDTVPEKPFTPPTTTFAVPLCPAEAIETVVGLLPITNSCFELKPGQEVIRLNASTEPSPVTWSYPVPALKPMLVVPLGQFVVPLVQGTLLFPLVMSWNAEGVLAAMLYKVGLTFDWPEDCVASLMMASRPAKVGAPAEVPPTAVKLLLASRNPFTQLPPEHIR